MTKAERQYMDKIASMHCICCYAMGNRNDQPVHVHHIREGQGMSQRASNFLTIPLCPECHQGKNGVHGNRSYMNIAKVTELDLLAMTIERMVNA